MALCNLCNSEVQDTEMEIITIGKGKKARSIYACSICAGRIEDEVLKETEMPNMLGAWGLGLAGGIISAVIWFLITTITKYELGIVALVVGWLVAKAVVIGSGKKKGIGLQIVSVTITLLSMIVGEYLIISHFFIEALKEQGYQNLPQLILPIESSLEVFKIAIRENPKTVLFWIIALIEAFLIPAATKIKRTKEA